MTDHALDALLAEYVPPPLPAGLAGRAVAAALALPQAPRPAHARPRHDRSQTWLRRPMLIGGIALGLAVSGAVAATLAGIRLDKLPGVEAVLTRLREPAPEAAPPPRPAPVQQSVPVVAAPAREEPVATPRPAQPPAPRAPAAREKAPPVAAPAEAPRPEPAETPRIEMPPAIPPAPRQEETVAAIVAERRDPSPAADEPLRLQREQLERTERLRAARQAQIERLQRLQQRRERIRRLRRD